MSPVNKDLLISMRAEFTPPPIPSPLRDSFHASRYQREIPTPWPKPVRVRVTLGDVWEIVGLTLVAGLSILVLPFAVLVLMEATR